MTHHQHYDHQSYFLLLVHDILVWDLQCKLFYFILSLYFSLSYLVYSSILTVMSYVKWWRLNFDILMTLLIEIEGITWSWETTLRLSILLWKSSPTFEVKSCWKIVQRNNFLFEEQSSQRIFIWWNIIIHWFIPVLMIFSDDRNIAETLTTVFSFFYASLPVINTSLSP